jgi:glycerate kinase
VGLEPALSRCDVVITGEGRFDASSAGGKAPCALARAAAARGVPVVVLAGSVAGGVPAEPGIAASFSVVPGPVSLEDALRGARAAAPLFSRALSHALARADAADNLARAAEQVVRLLEAARRLRRE